MLSRLAGSDFRTQGKLEHPLCREGISTDRFQMYKSQQPCEISTKTSTAFTLLLHSNPTTFSAHLSNMIFTKTLIFAFIGTALAFPEGVLVSNGLTRAPKVITRDIPRSELAKRDFDPTVISTEDHPTNPLMVRQICNPCSPDDCGACGSVG